MRAHLAMVALVVLAGCTGPAADSDQATYQDARPSKDDGSTTEATPEELELEEIADRGIILGTVVDETITPIPEVRVALLGAGRETVTDPAGRFGFDDLDIGAHVLEFHHPQFDVMQQVVAAREEPDRLQVVLTRIPGSEPFLVTLHQEGFIACGAKLGITLWGAAQCDPTGMLGMQARDQSDLAFDTGQRQVPWWYQTEIVWEPNQDTAEQLTTIQCATEEVTCQPSANGGRLCDLAGPSPLVCAIDRWMPRDQVPGDGNNLTALHDASGFAGVFSVGTYASCVGGCTNNIGFSVVLDQEFDVYANVFYNQLPPEGWLFTRDGAIE